MLNPTPVAERAGARPAGDRKAAPPSPLAAWAWTEAQADARALSPGWDPHKLLAGGLAGADAAVVVLAAVAAWALRHGTAALPAEILYAVALAVALTFNAMRISGAYTRHVADPLPRQVSRIARTWLLVSALLLVLGYFTKTSEEYSRLWAVGWCGLALAGFTGNRALALLHIGRLRQRGRLARTVAVVDLGGDGEALARSLQRHGPAEVHLVGVFEERRSGHRRNGVEDLVALARLFRIDEVLVAVSAPRPGLDVDAVLRRLGTIPTNVRLCPAMPKLDLVPRGADMVCGNHVLTMYQRPLPGWGRVAKRVEDLVLGSLLLAAAAPAMLAIALAVKLDSPGPVFFRQQRHGFNNNAFGMFKFRTMTHAASADPDVRQARRDDPRVTRVGRVLRRTSLDELPQLLNVLRGEMSLVGPRPHALAHNHQYAALIDDYIGRHRVQPGITGWAQVNGLRGETDTLDKMRRRVECDLVYIDNWSILLDLRILAQTALTVPFQRNAY